VTSVRDEIRAPSHARRIQTLWRLVDYERTAWGFMPGRVIHEKTSFPEYTGRLFANHGPLLFLNEDDSVRCAGTTSDA
jgi:hypothetical protein